jgi:hypothetical protein
MRQTCGERRSIVEPVFSLSFPLFQALSGEFLAGLEGVDFAPVFEDLLVVGGEGYRFDGCWGVRGG